MKVKELETSEQKKLHKLLLALPKTEIHLHLEGTASVETIWELMKKNNLNYNDISSKEDLRKKFRITNLDEFIDLFINIIQSSFSSEEDLNYLIRDTAEYLAKNNIAYSEIFFAPSKFISMGFDFGKMVRILQKGADEIRRRYNIQVKFIIDVSRSFGIKNAENNLQLVLDNPSDCIIGIGLGGAESRGPAKDYAGIFNMARNNGLHVVAHAGEDVGPESVWDTLKYLKAERIGHGISSILDPALMEHLRQTRIPLEICPTSNLFTRKYAKTLEDHPVREFFSKGLMVTINTDDPTLFSVTLLEEYMTLFRHGIFTAKEIIQLVKNNVFATFMKPSEKEALWKKCQSFF